MIEEYYGYKPDNSTIESCVNNLNFGFITENSKGQKLPVSEIYGIQNVQQKGDLLIIDSTFRMHLSNHQFKKHLIDTIEYAIKSVQ